MLNQNAFGHYLYSWDMLEVKGSRDKLTVRSTCPHCRDERTHGAGSGTVFLKSMSKELEGIGHFIFAGDTDESGIRLRNDIMKVLGEARCSLDLRDH